MLTSTTLAALALSICLLVYGCHKLISNHRFYNEMPGPPHSLLWGHMGIMTEAMAKMPPNMHSQALFTEIARTYNLDEIFYFDLWPIGLHVVVLNGPILIEQAAAIRRYPQHPLAIRFLDQLVGEGALAAVNGPLWKRLHKVVMPACSWANTHAMTKTIVDETSVFCQMLSRKAASGEAFSLEKLGGQLIFDIVGRVIMDVPLHAQTTGSDLLKDIQGIVEVAEASMSMGDILNPMRRLQIWWKKRSIASRIDPFIAGMICKRSAALARGEKASTITKTDPCNILDLLVEDCQRGNGEDMAKPLTAEQTKLVITNIKSFLLAASGTTNTSLSFLLMLLSKAPQVVESLRLEHETLLGRDSPDALARILDNPELLQSLPYTDAVCKEALRLFPVGISPKLAGPGETLTLNGAHYPVGDGRALFLNGHDLHYNPGYFPQPTRFMPERWLAALDGAIDENNKIPKRNFLTFATGPRICAGQNIVYTIFKIVLVMALGEFDLECADCVPNAVPRTRHTDLDAVFGDRIFQKWAVEAKPRGGMMMTVKKRAVDALKG